MKVWKVRHVGSVMALTLATALVCIGCREGGAPEAAKDVSKVDGASGQTATEGQSASVAGQVDQSGAVVENQTDAVAGQKRQAVVGDQTQSGVTPQSVEAVKPVVLPVGTALSGVLENTVTTDKSHVGDVVGLRVNEAVVVNGRTVVPAGAKVHGTVTHVRAAGRMKGAAELTIRFTELELPDGARCPITCDPYRRVVRGDGKETAAEIGGGATVGGVLGGVVGGKDDVLKGAAIGAAVGTGVAAATKGSQIVLPAGTAVTIRLAAPATLSVGSAS
jgi:hypothetical protein